MEFRVEFSDNYCQQLRRICLCLIWWEFLSWFAQSPRNCVSQILMNLQFAHPAKPGITIKKIAPNFEILWKSKVWFIWTLQHFLCLLSRIRTASIMRLHRNKYCLFSQKDDQDMLSWIQKQNSTKSWKITWLISSFNASQLELLTI